MLTQKDLFGQEDAFRVVKSEILKDNVNRNSIEDKCGCWWERNPEYMRILEYNESENKNIPEEITERYADSYASEEKIEYSMTLEDLDILREETHSAFDENQGSIHSKKLELYEVFFGEKLYCIITDDRIIWFDELGKVEWQRENNGSRSGLEEMMYSIHEKTKYAPELEINIKIKYRAE